MEQMGIVSKQVIINQISEEDQNNLDAIHGSGYKGQNYNPYYKNNRSEPKKCAHCKKPGHTVEKCFTKFPALRLQNL